MRQYLDLLQHVLDEGVPQTDRTGVGTISVFGTQSRYNLNNGFPAVTTKNLAWRAVVGELLWFLEGSTDERRLAEITYEKPRSELVDKLTIWTANANLQGVALGYVNTDTEKELGPIYGGVWRRQYNDQIDTIISMIKTTPDSRRMILTAWHPDLIQWMALPPCHTLVQFRVMNGKLHAHLYQRSGDLFLGVPFNIASYALLVHMLADICSLEPGDLVHTIGDAHIYTTHVDVVREQLTRTPRPLPKLILPPLLDLSVEAVKALRVSDFVLENYNPMGTLKAPMAV